MSNKKEVIFFNKKIPKNTSVDFQEIIKDDGTIEKINVRFYVGQEKGLHIIPSVLHFRSSSEQLITYPENTDSFLSGDDDSFDFPVIVPVAINDVLKIRAINTDLVFDYTMTVAVTVDYYAGQNRVITGVI